MARLGEGMRDRGGLRAVLCCWGKEVGWGMRRLEGFGWFREWACIEVSK